MWLALVSLGLVCLLDTFAVGVDRSAPALLTNFEKCSQECEKKFDGSSEAACKFGCQRADVACATNETTINECRISCSNNFRVEAESEACKHGCSAYPNESKSPIGCFLHMVNGLLENGAPDELKKNPESNPDDHPKARIMIVRRFRIQIPDEEDSESISPISGPFSQGGPVILPPSDFRSSLENNAMNAAKLENKEHEFPQIITVRKSESPSSQMYDAFHYLGSHPLIILFSITLLVLCILLVVQLSLECRRRRHRRAAQFQYNHFDELPTYVEATTIKIPADSNPTGAIDSDSTKA